MQVKKIINSVFIIDSDVFQPSGKSLALSKNDFANNILNELGEFKNVDFSAFSKIFDLINSIIEENKMDWI